MNVLALKNNNTAPLPASDRETVKIPLSLRSIYMSPKKRLEFYDQMATLVGSGISLIESLYLISAQTREKNLQKLYNEMIHRINGGMGLAQVMGLFPHCFPRMQSALVEAGEKSGNLHTILAELAENMEADQDFARTVKGAMFYPIILVVLAISLVTGMMIFVIPKISAMYEEAGVNLPPLTQKVIDISAFISNQWPVLLISILSIILVLWLFFSRTTQGRLVWEKFVSILPVAGKISKQKNLVMIVSSMGMLLKSGVLISESFAITEKTLGNLHYSRALKEIREGVVLGKEVSRMMGLEDAKNHKYKEHPLFPLQMAQMIHIGETTGTIAQMMMKLKKDYTKNINYILKNISSMIEPIMIIIVAGLVGSILLAVMLPFFYIGTTIH